MGRLNRVYYRLWQFWQAIRAGPLTEEAEQEVNKALAEAEMNLFRRQNNGAQQHSYRVWQSLKKAGQNDPHLFAAALLHDVGLAEIRTAWWDRPLVVLAQAFIPKRSTLWANGESIGWRRPFVVRANHPEWGAEAAAACGSSELTVELIRRHQDRIIKKSTGRQEEMLALLQWADNKN